MSQITTLIRSRMPARIAARRAGRALPVALARAAGRPRRAMPRALTRLTRPRARVTGLAGLAVSRLRTTRPTSRRGKRWLIGGAVVVGVALAVPLTRRTTRIVTAHLAGRRERAFSATRGLDPLTSLPNRAEAEWWLTRRFVLARARHQRLAVLVMDIDDFAACNEIYGRTAGDHVLQVTAARLQNLLRTGDMVCRTGNDTFMVIMDVAGPDHLIAKIGERVVAAVAEPISFHGEQIQVAASVGFAISHDREADPELLLGRADRAVIQAKASQRPIVQF